MKFTINNFFSTLLLIIFICGTTTIVSGQSTAISSLQLVVDFTSTVSYIDTQCGGALLSTDLTIYPPCKSFKDAGDRARQYLGQGVSVLIPNNNNLIISVINSAISPIISGQSTQLGNLYGFCSVDISISTGETHIILDGTLSTDSFLIYREPTVPYTNFQCTSNRVLRVKYMKFINWNQQTIFTVNVNQILNPMKTGITLSYINVENASSVFNVQPKSSSYQQGSLVVNILQSEFTGISSPAATSLVAPFNFIGSTTSCNNCSFKDSIVTTSSFIYQESGSLSIRLSIFNNININNAHSLVKTVNVGKNIRMESNIIANNTLSSYYHGSSSMVAQVDTSFDYNFYKELYSGNTIINSTNGVSNGFIFNQRYQGETYLLETMYLNVSDNNAFSTNKPFFSIENSELSVAYSEITLPLFTLYSVNSTSTFFYSAIPTNAPLSGNNSYVYFNYMKGTSPTNFADCEVCCIRIDSIIVYNTF